MTLFFLINHFRWEIIECSYVSVLPLKNWFSIWTYLWCLRLINFTWSNWFSISEINKLQVVVFIKYNILWLQISMHDILPHDVFLIVNQLSKHDLSDWLFDTTCYLDQVIECSIRSRFKNEIEVLFILGSIYEFDNIRVIQRFKQVPLSHDSFFFVSLNCLDLIDCFYCY